MTTVTYSRNVFLPLTDACRNVCSYCGFRSDKPSIMERRTVRSILKSSRKAGCKEALFTFGERPDSDEHIQETLQGWGYSDMTEYLVDLCRDAIGLGLLPHTNAGVLRKDEMRALKEVNASMGLMLESVSERLCGQGMPHEKSPGKRPDVRVRAIDDAGMLKIPFTTGILIGIGETRNEIYGSLLKIKELNDSHHHIQEIIIQNFKPKIGTPMAGHPEPSLQQMVDVVKAARKIMPDIHVQVPPNLNSETWPALVSAGVSDLGGISPTTKDYINPETEWPDIQRMVSMAEELGITVEERLAIYPKFIEKGWYSREIGELIEMYTGKEVT